MKRVIVLILIGFLYVNLYPQEQVLLHINSDGQQEALPLNKDDDVEKIIQKIEKYQQFKSINGVFDTLRYDDNLDVNFGFQSLDVAFQWYAYPTELVIREFWWRNYINTGSSKKAKIRIWRVNNRLFDIPNIAVNTTGRIGFYNSECDSCEYSITPFKTDSDAVFQYMANADTNFLFFDPLGNEWLPAPVEVNLDSNAWQKIAVNELGSFYLREMEPFGFTVQNMTLPSEGNERMEILSSSINSFDSTNFFNPSHSLKFYTNKSMIDSTIGWQIKNYDWGMYVVADLITDGPYLDYSFQNQEIPLQSDQPQKISAIINLRTFLQTTVPIKEAWLKYKIGNASIFATSKMSSVQDTFFTTIPPVPANKEVFMYLVVNDHDENRFHSNVVTFSTITSVRNKIDSPANFALFQNYPNPFNSTTNISYQIPVQGKVVLKIFDVAGKEIETLVNTWQSPGAYNIEWDSMELSSGMYFYTLKIGEHHKTRKLLLLK